MLQEFYAKHPIATWVFGIGALLVIIWALFSRAGGGGGDVQEGQVQYVTAQGQSDTAIQASATLEAARIAAASDARRQENEVLMFQAEKALENTRANNDFALANKGLDLNFNLQTFGIASSERISLAELNERREEFSMTAMLQKNADDNATRVELGRIQADADVNRSLINSNVAINSQNASVQKSNATKGLFSSIATGVAAIFSDERLKKNIVPVSVDNRGVKWFEYEYTDTAFRLDPSLPRGRVLGVMARQLQSVGLGHLVSNRQGFLAVNYGGLA